MWTTYTHLARGGETTIDNLVTACEDCNLEKGYLHGIVPMPLESIERWKDKPELALAKSKERRKILRREWQALERDRAQHRLRAAFFYYRYDRYMLRVAEGSVAKTGDALGEPEPSQPDRRHCMDGIVRTDAWIERYMRDKQQRDD